MNQLSLVSDLERDLNTLQRKFISGDIDFAFPDKLVAFAELTNRSLSGTSTETSPSNKEVNQNSGDFNILLVASNPASKKDLTLLEAELGYILEHIRNFKVEVLRQPTGNDLQDQFPLDNHGETIYDVLHFSGHGSEVGIYLYDIRRRTSQLFDANILKGLFASLPKKQRPQLIFLNSCASDNITNAVRTIIPNIITTKSEINEHMAITFSNTFYSQLAKGKNFKICFLEAKRSAIMLGADDSLFNFYENGIQI